MKQNRIARRTKFENFNLQADARRGLIPNILRIFSKIFQTLLWTATTLIKNFPANSI